MNDLKKNKIKEKEILHQRTTFLKKKTLRGMIWAFWYVLV